MAQQNALINGTLIFSGTFAGQASIQAQPIGGNLIFQLPNQLPTVNQLFAVESVSGSIVTMGFANASGAPSFSSITGSLALSQISTAGATSGDVIQYNGTNWAVSAFVPGSGTVTSVALTAPAEFTVGGSPITGAGTLAITKATQSANTVWAGPTTGSAAQPTFRALVAADVPTSLPGLTIAESQVTGLTAGLALLAPLASPALTGVPTAPTAAPLTNSTEIATTAYADAAVAVEAAARATAVALKAPLASPTFTGIVTVGAVTINAGSGAVSVTSIGATSAEFGTLEIDTNLILDTNVTFNSTATLTDGASSVGTSGQLLSSNATGVRWISQSALAIAGSQVTGNITGNAASITGSITESQVTGLVAALATIAPLSDVTGTAPAAGDNHIASGVGTLAAGTFTVTLTGAAVFADTNYVVQLTYAGAPTGTGKIYSVIASGSSFSVNSTVGGDADTISWTAIGY